VKDCYVDFSKKQKRTALLKVLKLALNDEDLDWDSIKVELIFSFLLIVVPLIILYAAIEVDCSAPKELVDATRASRIRQ